jgi:hypothetical protein
LKRRRRGFQSDLFSRASTFNFVVNQLSTQPSPEQSRVFTLHRPSAPPAIRRQITPILRGRMMMGCDRKRIQKELRTPWVDPLDFCLLPALMAAPTPEGRSPSTWTSSAVIPWSPQIKDHLQNQGRRSTHVSIPASLFLVSMDFR